MAVVQASRSLRWLYRRVPVGLRRAVALRLMALLAPYWSGARAPQPGPVRVVGLLSSSVGLGQGARLCAQSLKALGYQVIGVDVARWLAWQT